ncbi:MAG TPA: hypothetical protein VIM81_00855 [Gammaproteobacteria bacterium]
MNETVTTRRRFLVAAIGLCGSTAGLPVCRAWAQGNARLDAAELPSIVEMARRLYPHVWLPDEVYAEVLNDALTSVAAGQAARAAVTAAEAALDAGESGRFVGLDTAVQVEALRAIEAEPYFATIQMAVRDRLYNHPTVWEMLGYEGPSFERGGYLNRGAGDIDWLPETD